LGETDKKEVLKRIIRRLHEGADPEEVKEEFKDVLKGTESFDIAQIEQQLIEEGMPIEEIRRLCDVHLALFRESLEEEKVEVPEGHPIHILMEEHGIILGFAEELRNLSKMVKEAEDFDSAKENLEQLKRIAENFRDLYKLLDNPRETSFQIFAKKLGDAALSLAEMLSTHFYKENNILYPTALKIIPENEWKDIRHEFDELGYCGFTPKPPEVTIEVEKTAPAAAEGVITFETGTLTVEEMESVLNTLPVDITFVDKNDEVRYFSKSKERIFPRTKAVIGRKVQQCHRGHTGHNRHKKDRGRKKTTVNHTAHHSERGGTRTTPMHRSSTSPHVDSPRFCLFHFRSSPTEITSFYPNCTYSSTWKREDM